MRFLFKHLFIFIWLHWVLVEACRIFRCSMWDLVAKSRSPVGAWTRSHWTTREAPFLKTWFWSNYRFKQGYVPGTLYLVPPSGYVLHNYRTTARQEVWPWDSMYVALFSCVWIHVTTSIVKTDSSSVITKLSFVLLLLSLSPLIICDNHSSFSTSVILRSLWVVPCIHSFSNLYMETGGRLTRWKDLRPEF